MYEGDRKKLILLGEQYREDPKKYRAKFYSFVLDNHRNFDTNGWELFFDFIILAPVADKKDEDFWTTMYLATRFFRSDSKQFTFWTRLRIEKFNVIFDNIFSN
jgi:hypothetical protein